MKRIIGWTLALVLVLGAASGALAYDGTWYEIPELGIRLFLPTGWLSGSGGNLPKLEVGDAQHSWSVSMTCHDGGGMGLDTLLSEASGSEAYTNAQQTSIGGRQYVRYDAAEGEAFYLSTLLVGKVVTFECNPKSNGGFQQLVNEMLSSIESIP